MNLKQLHQFVVLAETGNLRRAAIRLHMAQPPLTVSIRKLEAELECLLFVRHSKGVTLTPCGEAVLTYVRQALSAIEQGQTVARGIVEGTRGPLRIGFVGSATYSILPKVVLAFRAAFPDVDLVFTESTTVDILRQLEQLSLDVGLVRFPVLEDTRHILTPMESYDFVVAVPAKSPLAACKRVSLSDLKDVPFIAHSPSRVPGLHAVFTLQCQAAGFIPKIAQEAVQLQTIISLVESGLGIALVPEAAARQTSNLVKFIPLADLKGSIQTGIALASQETTSRVLVQNFCRVARTVSTMA